MHRFAELEGYSGITKGQLPHFINKETEAQRGEVSCPQITVKERQSWSRNQAPVPEEAGLCSPTWLSGSHLALLTETQTVSHTRCYILYIAVHTHTTEASQNTRLLCIRWESTLCLYTYSYTIVLICVYTMYLLCICKKKTKLGTCKHTYYSVLLWKSAGLSLDTHTGTYSHDVHDLRLNNAQSL